MLGNGSGKQVGLSARALLLLVAVVSLAMFALGWWIDVGENATPGRTQADFAVLLAWAVVLSAILLVFRRRGPAMPITPAAEPTADRNDVPDYLLPEGIGQRIHDGPAQLLTYVMLRLDDLEDALRYADDSTRTAARQIVQDVRSASADALNDLRQISQQLA